MNTKRYYVNEYDGNLVKTYYATEDELAKLKEGTYTAEEVEEAKRPEKEKKAEPKKGKKKKA